MRCGKAENKSLFLVISRSLTCLHEGLFLTKDKDIATMMDKMTDRAAAIRLQNIGLKPQLQQRAHFAHGWCNYNLKSVYLSAVFLCYNKMLN